MASNPRLATEASPYLRSAAHQPVDWHPWGAEAFERAKREEKPILLDIGAVWCHWCHVMDHESYDDPETARLVNDRFIPVKVDRDERPDVDARYQKFVNALTGQGGWPLTAFLTPDGEVFYGGTYFPPADAHGRPSFRRVLEAVSASYRDNRESVLDHAVKIRVAVEERTRPQRGAGGALSDALLEDAVAGMERNHDAVNGGWGSAPKFPHPGAVTFLLRREAREDRATVRLMVERTLRRMGDGGVFDHVGGGFHRYSVDAQWIVPHFEKMLYDNAELLRNYAQACARYGDAFYREKAEEIVRFMDGVLSDRERGGFLGSQDADVHVGDDGDFFTWTLSELREALGDDPELARVLALRFDVQARGEMHHNPAKNVLRAATSVGEIARELDRPERDVQAALERGLTLLQEARARRKAPFVDPVIYANWNAMAVSAYLEFASATGDEAARDFALSTLDRLLDECHDPERGFAHTPGGVFGLLDDNAQMLNALIDAYNVSQESRHLAAARQLADLLLAEFPHPEGGFLDRAPGVAEAGETPVLGAPERPLQDSPTPSANARAIEGLLRMGQLTGEARYNEAANDALEATAPEARRYGLYAGAWFHAADLALHPPPHLVVAAEAGSDLHRAGLGGYAPGRTVHVATGSTVGDLEEVRAFLEGPAKDRPGVLVCLGDRCLAPAYTPEEVASRLAERA